jgi:surface polysaccharide O-acyltransferase-like enzyme
MLVYGLLSNPGGLTHPSIHQLITGGAAFHLWFIPALAVALTLVPWLVANAGQGVAITVCGFCSLAGLAFDAYRPFLPIPAFGGTRILAAPALVLIGIVLAKLGVKPKPRLAIPAVFLAWLLCWAEESAIAALAQRPAVSHAMVVSTYLLGMALFLAALSVSAGPLINRVARLGRISLGVYASHLLFVMWLASRWGKTPLYHSFAIAVLSTFAATLLAWACAKVRWLNRVVQ